MRVIARLYVKAIVANDKIVLSVLCTELYLCMHAPRCAESIGLHNNNAARVGPVAREDAAGWIAPRIDMPFRSFIDMDASSGGNVRAALRSSLAATRTKVRGYWTSVIENPRSRRPPLVIFSVLAAIIVVHYATNHGANSMGYTPHGPWYCVLGALFSHLSDAHLWNNAIMLLLVGWFLEMTEGSRHVASVVLGSACLGSAMHGAMMPRVRVRGASGAIYGLMASQLSLLALNCSAFSAPERLVRLVICATVLSYEFISWKLHYMQGVSYYSHVGGAIAGLCISLCFAKITRLRRRDVVLLWGGTGGYAALVGLAFSFGQLSAAALASSLGPFLVVRAALTSHRALVKRRTRSQLFPKQLDEQRRRRSTVLPMLHHGTHRFLLLAAKGVQPKGKRAVPPPEGMRAAGRRCVSV